MVFLAALICSKCIIHLFCFKHKMCHKITALFYWIFQRHLTFIVTIVYCLIFLLLLTLLVSVSRPMPFSASYLSCYISMYFVINCKFLNFRIQNAGEYLLVCAFWWSFYSFLHVHSLIAVKGQFIKQKRICLQIFWKLSVDFTKILAMYHRPFSK